MSWERLDPVAEYRACLCCPARGQRLDLQTWLMAGFGMVSVQRDDVLVFGHVSERDEEAQADRFEAVASRDPDHDWRIVFDGAMRRLVYQRHGIGEWMLVEAGVGFA